MSKGRRYELGHAEWLATRALSFIRSHSTSVEIAGSVRRGLAEVGDIDIVAVLDQTDPWAMRFIERELFEGLGFARISGGEEHVTFQGVGRKDDAPSIDLYLATEATWAITLLIRTGSAAHNIKLAQAAKRILPARHFTLHGLLNSADDLVRTPEEADVFRELGLPYLAPRDREAPELEYLVGAGAVVNA